MLTPLVLFFGLTVATAVIAYWSDNLGKKLGKKRISLLGMRPRTTATVLTIASSWGIMLFTLAVLLAVAKPLRDALFRFDRERNQNIQLRAQRDQLRTETRQIESKLVSREERLERVEKIAQTAETNAEKAQRQQQLAAKREIQARQNEKTARSRENAARQRENAARNREQTARRGAELAAKRAESARIGEERAQEEARAVRANLGAARTQLEQNRQRLQSARAQLASADSQLENVNARLGAAQTNLAAAQTRLDRANEVLARVRQSAETAAIQANLAFKEAAEALAARNRAEERVAALSREQRDLETQIARLNSFAQGLSLTVNQLSTRPVLVPVGKVLVSRTLPAGLSAVRVESHLRSVFGLAQDRVPELLPGATARLTQIAQGTNGEAFEVPEAQVFLRAAQFIANSGREVSVRLVSVSNFAEGEPQVFVRFEVVEVRRAIPAGEVLASVEINGNSGDAAIFNALLRLIEAGRAAAVRRGVNPPESPDDPNFYENGTNEQIFDALRRISTRRETVNVSLVAADDLSTVEPMRVRFLVS